MDDDALWEKHCDIIGMTTACASILFIPVIILGKIPVVIALIVVWVLIVFPNTQKLFELDHSQSEELTWLNIYRLAQDISAVLFFVAIPIVGGILMGFFMTGIFIALF